MRILRVILFPLLILATLLIAVFFGFSHYIQSQHFSAKLIDYIERSDVASVHDVVPIKLLSIYPHIQLRLPKISLSVKDETSSLKLHLANLDLNADYAFIRSQGQRGHIRLNGQSLRGVFKSTSAENERDDLLASYHFIARNALAVAADVNMRLGFESIKLLTIYLDTSESSEHIVSDFFASKEQDAIQVHYTKTNHNRVIHHAHRISQITLADQHVLNAHYSYSVKDSVAKTLVHCSGDVAFSEDELSLSSIEFSDHTHSLAGQLSITQDQKWAVSGKLFWESDFKIPIKNELHSRTFASANKKLLDDEPLPFKLLTQFDTELELIIPSYGYAGQHLFSGKLTVHNSNNQLHITSKRSKFLDGAVKISVMLDDLDSLPSVKLKIKGFDHDLQKVMQLGNDQNLFDSGLFDLHLDLTMQGMSIAELFSKSNGAVELAARDISINDYMKNLLHLAGLSLPTLRLPDGGSSTPPVNNKLSEVEDVSVQQPVSANYFIPCFSINSNIAKGYLVAEDGILLKSGQGLIIGSGIVDFHTERILFDTRVQKNSPIDLNPFSVLKYMTLSGTLAEPTVNINQNEVIKKGITTAAALTLGFVPSLALTAIQEANAMKKKKLECKATLF